MHVFELSFIISVIISLLHSSNSKFHFMDYICDREISNRVAYPNLTSD